MKGLSDMITESNTQLSVLKRAIEKKQLDKKDALYEVFSKVIEVFDDNVELRMQANNYIAGIVTQAQSRLEATYEENSTQKSKRKSSPGTIKEKEAEIAKVKTSKEKEAKSSKH